MRAQAYHDLKKRQDQEIEDFPIAYAFNKQQLEEALTKLGATDISECCTVLDIGDIVKKENADKLVKMLSRHVDEIHELLKSDEQLAEEIFRYEMDNHEYAINWDGDYDVTRCLGLTEEQVVQMGLDRAYARARRSHVQYMEDLGVI